MGTVTDARLQVIDEGLIVAVGAPPTSPDPAVLARLDALEAATASLEARSIRSRAGTPEGALVAPVGTVVSRTDGGTMSTLYVKEAGTGNIGWVPSSAAYPDIQLFTTSGVWTKPPLAKTVFVRLIAGGGGGGSG